MVIVDLAPVLAWRHLRSMDTCIMLAASTPPHAAGLMAISCCNVACSCRCPGLQYTDSSLVVQGSSNGCNLQYSCKGVNCPRVENAGVGEAVRDSFKRVPCPLQRGQQHHTLLGDWQHVSHSECIPYNCITPT